MAKCHMGFLPSLAAWIILIVATASFFIFICPFLQDKYHVPVSIFQGIISVFLFANFILAQFMDAGTLTHADPAEYKDDDYRKAPYIKVIQVDEATIRMKWCVTCQFYRPPRCSHCSVCGSCIETFDHHCPWINNCIGKRNYRHFFLFLVFLSIHMMSIFGWCILYLINHKEKLKETNSVAALSLIILIFFLCWPIFGLTIFHSLLISRNRTTNEQMTGKFKSGENPFDQGCCFNCADILCGPQIPEYKSSRQPQLESLSYNEEPKASQWL